MKKTYLAVAVAAVFSASGVALAQDYRMEGGLGYADDSFTEMKLDFTYHINAVDTVDRPLAEAAFLGRNSNISAYYISQDDNALEDTVGLGAEWWLGNIYIAADYSDTDSENETAVRLGYMSDDLLAYVGFVDVGFGSRGEFRAPVALGSNVYRPSDTDGMLIGVKYVADAVSFEAEVTRYDDGLNTTRVQVGADYYVNNNFSIGGSADTYESFDSTFGIRSRYFFTPVLSAELSVDKAESGDDELTSARIAYRF